MVRSSRSRSKARGEPPEPSGIDLPLSPPRAQRKRPPNLQSPAHNTPTRQHNTSRLKPSSPSKSKYDGPVIKDITINNLQHITPKQKLGLKKKKDVDSDAPDDDWYRACYTITFTNCKARDSRIKVWVGKNDCSTTNPATTMMNKARTAIKLKANDLGLDVKYTTNAIYFEADWPWKLLWSSYENEVLKFRLASMEKMMNSIKGKQTQVAKTSKADWKRGKEFACKSNLWFAKNQYLQNSNSV